jgi:hypothetical protein
MLLYADEHDGTMVLSPQFAIWQDWPDPTMYSVLKDYIDAEASTWKSFYKCPSIESASDALDYGGAIQQDDYDIHQYGWRMPIDYFKYGQKVVLTDRFWGVSEHNHINGINMLWGDSHISWLEDNDKSIIILPGEVDWSHYITCGAFSDISE